MTEWNQSAMDRLVADQVAQVTARAGAVIRQRVSFPLTVNESEIVAGPEGVLAEYGTPDVPGTPWVFDGIRSLSIGRKS